MGVPTSRMRNNLLYEDEEVGELIKAELDGRGGNDRVDVFYHS